ncbi:MAG: glycerophosphodiester phosphodiesterase [Anaerolineae bacterium]
MTRHGRLPDDRQIPWLSAQHPLIIGHRGASAYAPENTLAAFELAVSQGADGIELDVRLSADGWPVISHDPRVDRVTAGTGTVSAFTAAQLRAFELGNGQTMPMLGDVFDLLGPRVLYNIELKDFGWRDRGTEAAVASCVKSYRLEDRVLISSFNPLSIRRAHRYLPHIPLALIHFPGWKQINTLFRGGAANHPHFSLVNETYMAWAYSRNYRVHAWTVDDPGEARRLVSLGVHGIITNKPDVIRQSLQQAS